MGTKTFPCQGFEILYQLRGQTEEVSPPIPEILGLESVVMDHLKDEALK